LGKINSAELGRFAASNRTLQPGEPPSHQYSRTKSRYDGIHPEPAEWFPKLIWQRIPHDVGTVSVRCVGRKNRIGVIKINCLGSRLVSDGITPMKSPVTSGKPADFCGARDGEYSITVRKFHPLGRWAHVWTRFFVTPGRVENPFESRYDTRGQNLGVKSRTPTVIRSALSIHRHRRIMCCVQIYSRQANESNLNG